jgi:hypothetical protein
VNSPFAVLVLLILTQAQDFVKSSRRKTTPSTVNFKKFLSPQSLVPQGFPRFSHGML